MAEDGIPTEAPLRQTVSNGGNAVARFLIDTGIDVEAKDRRGQTLLWCAASNGHTAVVNLLLGLGADVDTTDDIYGETPLFCPVFSGNETIVKLLLANGADVEARDEVYGEIPLMRAALGGHEAIVRLLLENGANVETKDRMLFDTPLFGPPPKGTMLWWSSFLITAPKPTRQIEKVGHRCGTPRETGTGMWRSCFS